jgi:hypothetical protein
MSSGEGTGRSYAWDRGNARSKSTDRQSLTPPFIVGESSLVNLHLPKLGERFLPYTEAKVTVTSTVGDATTAETTSTPERPGVFPLKLTPTKAGTGRLVVSW